MTAFFRNREAMSANSRGRQPTEGVNPRLEPRSGGRTSNGYRRFAAQTHFLSQPWADAHGYSLPLLCDYDQGRTAR